MGIGVKILRLFVQNSLALVQSSADSTPRRFPSDSQKSHRPQKGITLRGFPGLGPPALGGVTWVSLGSYPLISLHPNRFDFSIVRIHRTNGDNKGEGFYLLSVRSPVKMIANKWKNITYRTDGFLSTCYLNFLKYFKSLRFNSASSSSMNIA
jgi:hypothetical protein